MTSQQARLNPVQDLRQPLLAWVLPHHTPPQQRLAIMVTYGAMTSQQARLNPVMPGSHRPLGSCHIIHFHSRILL